MIDSSRRGAPQVAVAFFDILDALYWNGEQIVDRVRRLLPTWVVVVSSLTTSPAVFGADDPYEKANAFYDSGTMLTLADFGETAHWSGKCARSFYRGDLLDCTLAAVTAGDPVIGQKVIGYSFVWNNDLSADLRYMAVQGQEYFASFSGFYADAERDALVNRIERHAGNPSYSYYLRQNTLSDGTRVVVGMAVCNDPMACGASREVPMGAVIQYDYFLKNDLIY